MIKYFLLVTVLFNFIIENVNSQTWLWATKAGGVENDYCKAIDVDVLGNSYVTGTFLDSALFGSTTLISLGSTSVYIAKYDISGNFVWAKIAAKGASVSVSGICIDLKGNISIVGQYSGTANFGISAPITLTSVGSYDVYVSQYNSTGDVMWAKSLGSSGIDYPGNISRDNNGNVFLTGDFHITSFPYSSSKIFVAKFDSTGNNIWLKTEVNYGLSHFGNGIKTDSKGNSYITGDFFNSIKFSSSDSIEAGNIESNGYLAKFDSSGNFLWGQSVGSAAGYCVSKAIDIDAGGNSYITGSYRGTISLGTFTITGTSGLGYDVYIAKCDAGGNFDWVNKSIGAAGSNGISLDNFGNAFVCGNFYQPIQFGSNALTNVGNSDIFITEIDQSGNFIWATSFGGLQNDFISGAINANSNGIFLAGYFADTIHFGTTLSLLDTSIVKSDIFIAKLNTTTGIEDEKTNDVVIYPNPTTGQFRVILPTGKAEITVTDVLGKFVLSMQMSQETTSLQIDKSGVYIVYITTKKGITIRKLVISG